MSESNLRSSILLRMSLVLVLTLLLLIPTFKIESLIEERAERRNAAIEEVNAKWANAQTVVGPILTIPMKRVVRDSDGKESIDIERVNLLPDTLVVMANLGTEVRYRGIYHVVLYNMKLKARGTFDFGPLQNEDWKDATPLWQEAYLTIGISDLRGIKDNVVVTWNSTELYAHSGVKSEDIVRSGITFFPRVSASGTPTAFEFAVNLNGSSDLAFAPVGRHTEVDLHSSWPSPSFNGVFLPDQRSIGPDGFSAKWTILELNRNYPQAWIADRYKPEASKFGVTLLESVDQYQKTHRTTKYAMMIVALTFMALFLSEVLAGELLHPIHYTLVGLALVLFYLLLLSLSEQLGFGIAYAASSIAVLLLVTLYTYALLSKKQVAYLVGVLILLLYVFLYVLLQLEDFALLIGSLVLLTILSFTMYLTRKVNWFSVRNGQS